MSIKKNFAYQLGYELIILLLPLAVTPYVSRTLGRAGVGDYAYSLTVAQYFVLFSMLGIRNYGNRLIAQCKDDRDRLDGAFSSLLCAHLLISALVCLAYFAFCRGVGGGSYALLQMPLVVSAVLDISWLYYGLERFKLVAAAGSAVKVLSAALVLLIVRGRGDVWKYCLIMSSGVLLQQAVLWLPLRRHVRIVRPRRSDVEAHFKPLLVLFLPAIAVSVYKQMDKVMLGLMSTRGQLGCYQYADTAVGTPMTVIEAFGSVMLPRMSYLSKAQRLEDTDRYLRVSMKYVMCLALPMAFGLSAVGPTFAPLFWGADFTLTGRLMQWLAITVPFIAFSNVVRTQFLLPNHRDADFVVSVFAGAACNLAVNLCLIPKYGAMGATVGTIAAEVLVCAVQVFAVRKEVPLGSFLKSSLPFALFGACMFGLVRRIGLQRGVTWAGLGLQLAAGVASYGLLAGFYLWFTKDVVFLDTVRQSVKRINRDKLAAFFIGAALFIELFLAVPYDYVATLPQLNKLVYALQAAAALLEAVLLIAYLARTKGSALEKLRGTVRAYTWMSVLLIAFVAYNWVVTFWFKSLPPVTSIHYLVQTVILALGTARAFRQSPKAALFAAALYFWIAIIANSAVFLLKPEGLYVSSSLSGITHECYLFGLDNQFGKIYFAGLGLIWFYEERYQKTYFMTLSSLLIMLYTYFKWNNGTGMVVSLALVALILVYNLKWLRWTLSMKLFILAIAVIVISIFRQDGLMYGGSPISKYIADFTAKSEDFSSRLYIWSAAVEKIRGSLIFGYGRVPENLHVVLYETLYNAHNQALQVWLDGGAIGLGLFAACFVYADFAGARRARRMPELRILFIGVFTSLLYFMMEVGTMLPMFLCLLLICLCAKQGDGAEARGVEGAEGTA